MATETLKLKTPELAVDSPPKEEADSVKDTTEKKVVAPVSEDAEKKKKEEAMKDKGVVEGEANGGERVKSPVTPLSERPTRERKRTERYISDTDTTPPSRSSGNKPGSIEQGRGTRLKEIPNVAYKLSKRKPDDNLFLLHTILYGKKGKAQTLKKNIGQFSGFVWSEQEEEKQRARTKEKLDKCIKEKLIDLCDVLDIPNNKSNEKKDELAVKVLEFLVHPKVTRDVVLADSEKETKKRKKSTPNNLTSGESSDVPAKKRRQTKSSGKKQDKPSETEEGNGEADVGSEDEDTETEDEKDNAKEKKKSTDKKSLSKRTKKEKPAAEEEKSLKGSAKSGRKSSKQVDKSTASSSKKQEVDKDDSSKEKGKKQTSKPQAKGSKDQGAGKSPAKGKKEPTRKELHVVVAKILKEVDFNTATLSDILRKLGSHFGVDLMHRKTEVKDIVTDAINEMSDGKEKDENTENER
ncbi:PREDICTED: protein DEK-like [Camelina sativa]|uniref:Protein DEK-like n=1 Tax=Camelina sativa TaxID=90675 RepID=A0ABM0ZFY4_CAMSA|nr:PREDICTED: protein DEK-like [Camelina sativa]XP_010515190.1 PREDICTED: protein DEK-like [Camelina sativa]